MDCLSIWLDFFFKGFIYLFVWETRACVSAQAWGVAGRGRIRLPAEQGTLCGDSVPEHWAPDLSWRHLTDWVTQVSHECFFLKLENNRQQKTIYCYSVHFSVHHFFSKSQVQSPCDRDKDKYTVPEALCSFVRSFFHLNSVSQHTLHH